MTVCTFWSGSWCSSVPARLYVVGWRCDAHTPAVLAGRTDIEPDPARTLDGIRASGRGQQFMFRLSDTALIDERAVASGRRRSSPSAYRAAQAAEATRKTTNRPPADTPETPRK